MKRTLLDKLQNPLTRERDQIDRARILRSFPTLGTDSERHALVLRRYLDDRPEKFFDCAAFDTYLRWLQMHDQTRPTQLKSYFNSFRSEIGRALLFLRELNREEWHDSSLKTGDDYDLIRIVDKHIHPAYLRLVEGVFTQLIRPLAYFSRIHRNKGVEGLDIWSIADELKGQNEEHLLTYYQHTIRNGIAHGGISFLQREIRYRDLRGNHKTVSTSFVIRNFDDLLDVCNGLAAATKAFFLTSQGRGYIPPRELMIEALQELVWAPWWTIEGCVEAEIGGRSQLTIYAKPDSRDNRKVVWSTVQSAILSEYLASGYDRYFFSLRTPKLGQGWAAFDGHRLRDLRQAEADDLSAYQGILEGIGSFYIPRPGIPAMLAQVDTLITSARIAIPTVVARIREGLGKPRFFFRNATLHRNSWGAVLQGDIVIDGLDGVEIVRVIRKSYKRFIRVGKRYARRNCRFTGTNRLPIGYAQVAVFKRDYRKRRLSGFGLAEDLVCTVRLQRIRRIRAPDILGSTIETKGKWRIAWNKAWLDSVGQRVLDEGHKDIHRERTEREAPQ